MIELGLQRISKLLAQTPLPWRAIHVAGTNGKGSVCTYVSEMLNTFNRSKWRADQGHSQIRHGLFTSPHIIDRWDCISLSNGDQMEMIKPELFFEIEEKVAKRNRELNINASEFELLTATAFEVFTHSKLDVAVVETGMGGRLDATNIIGQPVPDEPSVFRPPPLVTAITKIGIDHQGFLGDTKAKIAHEKAGILKPGVPAVWDNSNESEVRKVLVSQVTQRGSIVRRIVDPVRQDFLDVKRAMAASQHVKANTEVAFRSAWNALSQLGKLQSTTETSENSEAIKALVTDMASAPQRVKFPGRQEWIDISRLVDREMEPPVLLDGAHNANSAGVLNQAVDKLRAQQHKPIIWIFAASDTKDVKDILLHLLHKGDEIFTVEFGPVDGMPWVKPMKGVDILAAVKDLLPPGLMRGRDFGGDVLGALREAIQRRRTLSNDSVDANVVIAGSLYLVGDIHRLLRKAESDR